MQLFFFYHTTKKSTHITPQTFKVRDISKPIQRKKLIAQIPPILIKIGKLGEAGLILV
jgi:hypothetical protein